MLARLRAPEGVAVQLAEAEVTVGHERAHGARLGERERVAIVGLGLTPLGVDAVRVGGDVAEQM
jgi:hypothetical protein